MNDEIKSTLNHRQTLLDNTDELIDHYKNKNKKQLSLFDEDSVYNEDLKLKSNVNFNELLAKEKEAIGLCVSYNKLLRYRLIKSSICNTDIKEIFFLNKDKKKLKFLGELISIRHMIAKNSGNKYAKLLFEDETGIFEFYLFGKDYKDKIKSLFINHVYLVMCSYNSIRSSASVTMITNAESFKVDKFIKRIYIKSNSIPEAVKLRTYVYKNMVGNSYELFYRFEDKEFKAPYRININKNIVEDLSVNGYIVTSK